MPNQPPTPVTLSAIARRAGVSLATVSYALRQHPKISAETRAAVLEAAARLGYRPNPRIASLMAHIRGGRAAAAQERLAFVWVHTSRQQSRQDRFLRSVVAGARRRASQLGFGLEEFWTNDEGMTDRRLEQILRARGIVGVVLSPVTTAEASITLEWEWRHFAAAVIGNVTWTPELDHAGHHHFLGMRLALDELERLGLTRPAALIEQAASDRSKRAWEAAFLTHHRHRAGAGRLLRIIDSAAAGPTAAWLRDSGADSLIVSAHSLIADPTLGAAARKLRLPVFTLHWDEDAPPDMGGVDQRYDVIAGHAVDLVAAQLNANETGQPELPCLMLFPGRWVAPRRPVRQGKAKAGSR